MNPGIIVKRHVGIKRAKCEPMVLGIKEEVNNRGAKPLVPQSVTELPRVIPQSLARPPQPVPNEEEEAVVRTRLESLAAADCQGERTAMMWVAEDHALARQVADGARVQSRMMCTYEWLSVRDNTFHDTWTDLMARVADAEWLSDWSLVLSPTVGGGSVTLDRSNGSRVAILADGRLHPSLQREGLTGILPSGILSQSAGEVLDALGRLAIVDPRPWQLVASFPFCNATVRPIEFRETTAERARLGLSSAASSVPALQWSGKILPSHSRTLFGFLASQDLLHVDSSWRLVFAPIGSTIYYSPDHGLQV